MKKYTILTSLNVDIANQEDKTESLFDEQLAILDSLNIDFGMVDYLVRFGNGHTHEMTIQDAIQGLALKDGADLVRFESGNVGYVGYYNGISNNYFEIIPLENLTEHCEKSGRDLVVSEDDLMWVYEMDPSDMEKASDLVEWSIDAWYNTTDYPEYESVCIGDVIEEKFEENNIEYTYKKGI